MKQIKLLALALVLTASQAFSADSQDMMMSQWKLYGGLTTINVKATGYKDEMVSLNDHHRYPVSTGQTLVNFGKGNVNKNATGIQFGTQYLIAHNHGPVIEINFASGAMMFATGYKYSHKMSDKFSISGTGKLGYASITVDLGKVEKSDLVTSRFPINTTSGSFNQGDAISAKYGGVAFALEAEVAYEFTKELAGFFKLGFIQSSLNSGSITIGGKELDDTAAIDSGTASGIDYSSNIDPFKDVKAEIGGVTMTIGATYKI